VQRALSQVPVSPSRHISSRHPLKSFQTLVTRQLLSLEFEYIIFTSFSSSWLPSRLASAAHCVQKLQCKTHSSAVKSSVVSQQPQKQPTPQQRPNPHHQHPSPFQVCSLVRFSYPPNCSLSPFSDFQSGALTRNITPPQPRASHPQTNSTSFTALLNDITHCLSTTPSPSLPRLHALLRAYESNPDQWSKFAHANPDKQYTRNLVCEVPGIFNLLLLVWTPGKASPVHDHADSHCLMKVCHPFSAHGRSHH
jgi:hypothetical protein